MELAFPTVQHGIAPRLLVGLSKIALVLRHQGWSGATEKGVTPTQVQILSVLFARRPHTMGVSALATELSITKPTVSDSVAALVRKGLLEKTKSQQDARAVELRLTPKGEEIAAAASLWPDALLLAANQLCPEEQAVFLRAILKMVHSLQEEGLAPDSRSCLSCQHFVSQKQPGSPEPHYCEAFQTSLSDTAIQFDCREHVLAGRERRVELWRTFDPNWKSRDNGGNEPYSVAANR